MPHALRSSPYSDAGRDVKALAARFPSLRESVVGSVYLKALREIRKGAKILTNIPALAFAEAKGRLKEITESQTGEFAGMMPIAEKQPKP